MISLALSGGIASGKSLFSQYLLDTQLADYPLAHIDYDVLAREVLANVDLQEKICTQWGNDLAQSSGGINRALLARRVFNDAEELAKLNSLMHPLIFARAQKIENEIVQAGSAKAIIHDIPLLFGSELAFLTHANIILTAPLKERENRLREIRKMTQADITQRVANQPSFMQLQTIADVVVHNDRDKNTLQEKAKWLTRVWIPTLITRRKTFNFFAEHKHIPAGIDLLSNKELILQRLQYYGIVTQVVGEKIWIMNKPDLQQLLRAGYVLVGKQAVNINPANMVTLQIAGT